MPVSQNGWPASPDPAELGVEPCAVAGVPIGDGLKAGPVTTVLSYVLLQLHRRVEPLVEGWCWGYKYRPIAGTETLSNHASGTAVDVNAPDHPRFYRGTFNPYQMSEINQILSEVGGVVRWGGDYRGVPDEMHFEINADEAAVAAVATELERRMQILDYSAGYPGALHIQRLGYGGVIRYLRKEGTSIVKPITVAEVADMRAYGLAIALVYQHVEKSRPTQGWAAGRHDAEWALARAREVGIDPPAIYLAVDFDADPPAVAEYFRGAADVLARDRLGAYGGYRVVSYLFDQGLIRWGWQTVAWSAGRREGRAHLFQRLGQITVNGIQCDVNDVLKAEHGQTPAPTQEDDMSAYETNMIERISERLYAALNLKPHIRVTGLTDMGTGDADRTIDEDVPLVERFLAVERDVAELKARPVADVDETALAAELDRLGIGGATAEEVKDVVRQLFARAGQPEGSVNS